MIVRPSNQIKRRLTIIRFLQKG